MGDGHARGLPRDSRIVAYGTGSAAATPDRKERSMLTSEENELLCRVECDATMGQLMRRHWQPICLVEEVSEPDGKPVRARMFGEDLVVFRDSGGRLGVL